MSGTPSPPNYPKWSKFFWDPPQSIFVYTTIIALNTLAVYTFAANGWWWGVAALTVAFVLIVYNQVRSML
jgi:membrane protein insertase Oxa1/YidC/SpoIIIJ